jgi:catechol 2,3-dioxygenase-like lactoylglutathione lyase family enzyme
MMRNERAMNRREMFGLIGAGVLTSGGLLAQEQQPEFAGLDHIEFYVSNVEKSRDLFARIFGNPRIVTNDLKVRNGKRYLKLGRSYMAFEQPKRNGSIKVDHFSIAIRGLDMPRLHAHLAQRAIEYQDYPSGRDTGVNDPDAIRTQLSPEDGWSLLNPATFLAETVAFPEKAIFEPSHLMHVLLNVTDVDGSAAFYQKLLGNSPEYMKDYISFRIDRSRTTPTIGLRKTPDGERSGVARFDVSVISFDYESAVRRLRQLGVKVEDSKIVITAEFSDPDGMRIRAIGNSFQ